MEFGVLWLNIVLDSVLDSVIDEDESDDTARRGELLQASQGKDIVLIQKKRVVIKKYYLEQTLLTARVFTPREVEPPTPVACTYDVPFDLIHDHADGHYFLRTGLSPPPILS
jgi:hypothetical protein